MASSRIKSTRLAALGRYRLLAAIGQGGMAEVFLAATDGPGQFSKLLAVKVLRPEFAEDPDGREMFLNEARLAARLAHPNVVQTIEVSENGNQLYLVMEYLEGQAWSRLMQHGSGASKIPMGLAARVLIETLNGLHYAHELRDFSGAPLSLVHRDVSPQNVFVTYDGQVKVLDFGIAKALETSDETRTGVLKGKIGYLAPEQLSDAKLDRRVDVYAAGVMLWELLVGRKPWKGISDVAYLAKIASEGLPRPSVEAPGIDPELDRICARATARNRDERYATAADFAADLEAWVESSRQPASARALGKWASEAFADVREETRRLIERQLTRVRAMTPETLDAMIVAADRHGSSIPSLPQAAVAGTGSVSVESPKPARGSMRAVILTMAAAAVASGVWFVSTRAAPTSEAHAAAPPPANAPANVAQPTEQATKPKEATLRVGVTPATARIYVDDVELTGNPASRVLVADGTRHVVRVEAPGYLPHVEETTVDKDKTLSVALERVPAASAPAKKAVTKSASKAAPSPPPPPAAVAVVAPAPPPPTAAPPPPAAPKKKTLDEENPFAH